ncbi:MAG: hypothetical protein ACMUIU_06180 [bacterium]
MSRGNFGGGSYYKNELFCDLHNRHHINDSCQDCFYSRLCRGGLKCLFYALIGDPVKIDPGC